MLEFQHSQKIQLINIFIEEARDSEIYFLNTEKFAKFLHKTPINNLIFIKEIYITAIQVSDLLQTVEMYPIKHMEEEYWSYFDPSCGYVLEPVSDFFRIKKTKQKTIANEFTDYSFKTYLHTDSCGICKLTYDEMRKLKDHSASDCKCKRDFIESFEYDWLDFYSIRRKIPLLIKYLELAYDELKNIKLLDNDPNEAPSIINKKSNSGYPMSIFKSEAAYILFKKLHKTYKEDTRYTTANYSFIYFAMEKDNLITERRKDYMDFLAELKPSIIIDKVCTRQSGKNKRTAHYESCKALIK
ncbi:hypothetical protein [Mangrovimonas xylaniphaga]|uniref:hypothetical protein n=1 Tax=Mangrovimonas xylaniphaga TaxID=1645915 RepID=UPI0006B5FEBF|nr:hypothetical protein [Mangrovimonas xylaniphaga]